MEARALGKGLSALIPERAEDLKAVVTQLKTSAIRNNSFQPRTNYDDGKQAELIASIKEKGVLQPILIRKKGEHFEVIAGERRLRAARALSIEEVPVIIKDASDEEALVLALIENIQREELNPIEEARAFKRLIDEFRFTQDSVAQSVGKDRSTVSNLLRLLKLPEDLQQHVFSGALSEGHARTLLGVDSAETQRKIAEQVIKKGLSVRDLELLIKAGFKSGRPRAKSSSRDPQIGELEELLQSVLGTKVRIAAQKKRGKIVIEYYSLDDLKRILNIFKK
jgi:ParB family chromosome partitioning protein